MNELAVTVAHGSDDSFELRPEPEDRHKLEVTGTGRREMETLDPRPQTPDPRP